MSESDYSDSETGNWTTRYQHRPEYATHVQHIVETERSYVEGLLTLRQAYGEELMKRAVPSLLSAELYDFIFGGVVGIWTVNIELLSQLEKAIDHDSDASPMGKAFLSLIPFLKIYTAYINKFDDASAALRNAMKRSAKLTNLLNEIQYEKAGSKDIFGLLILPVQRIPRYNLLLRDLIKYTDPKFPQLVDLNEASEKMEVVADVVNQRIAETKLRQAIRSVEERIRNCPPLTEPQRVYMFEAGPFYRPISHVGLRRGVGYKPRWCFVFSDCVIICGGAGARAGVTRPTAMSHMNGKGDRDLYYKHLIRFVGARVVSLKKYCEDLYDREQWPNKDVDWLSGVTEDDKERAERALVITSPSESFLLIAETKAIAEETLKSVEDEIAKVVNGQSRARRAEIAAVKRRPAHLPSIFAPRCFLCGTDFAAGRKRDCHVCATCGRHVCRSLCTSKYNGETFCTSCYMVSVGYIETVNPLIAALAAARKAGDDTTDLRKRKASVETPTVVSSDLDLGDLINDFSMGGALGKYAVGQEFGFFSSSVVLEEDNDDLSSRSRLDSIVVSSPDTHSQPTKPLQSSVVSPMQQILRENLERSRSR